MIVGAEEGPNVSHAVFVFVGFPETYAHRGWYAVPVLLSYVLLLLGNFLLLHVIRSTAGLHSPMYALVSALAAVNVVVPTAIIPKMLLEVLFDLQEITLAGCLAQMFVTHFFSSVESTILLAMALDRYVAICHPLRYVELVNVGLFGKLLAFTLVRSGAVMLTLVGLVMPLRFCGSNVISHCYCDHMALVSLACGNTDRNNAMGVAVIVCFVGVDISLIVFSYVSILYVVLRAAAGEDRWKAFHTCGTHLMVMMSFYLVGSVTFLSHNLGIPIPVDANTCLGLLYIVFPASVNPIIYGVRTKEIRLAILKIFKVQANKVFVIEISSVRK
ncbi:olfactory receptor 52K2 [Engraulis encrasicolus]|uniref:olfactory receptor 52K2 n=1 Tax=Engraulis encrasicolus TaxID=184585 RepID=UPI002FCF4DA6